ncbi:MAG: TIGR02099 family protein [Lysobacter sp.]|nr:TIGR02099 family protein [Lysobacter sp.]
MPTSLRRRLRLARRGLWYVTAVSLVLLALVAGIVSQVLPLAERHPDRIAEWLTARAGRPVQFDRVQTEWTRRGPLLRLDGLRVGEGKDAVAIGAAEILVSQYAGLLPGRSFTELRVRNLALTLERADDGRWQVRGLPGQSQGGDPLGALEGLGELQVIDARLGISAPSLQIDTMIPDVDVRLQVSGDRVRGGLRARIRDDASPIDVVLDFDRDTGDGHLYAAAKNADLSAWSPLLRIGGVRIAAGRGRAEVWATLRKRQVAAISVDGDLSGVRLRGAPFKDDRTALAHAAATAISTAAAAPVATFARLQTVAHWSADANGWRLDAPSMQVHAEADSKPQILDGLVLAGGKHYGLRAERIDAGPLFAVIALSDRLDPGLRRWLASAKPGAVLERVRVGGLRGGAMTAAATVRGLQFASVGNSPGISGLGGDLRGDGDGLSFEFDPASNMRFDWPRGFGVVHAVGLRGEAIGWRDGDGWRVETPALRIDGEGYGADVRGGLWFEGDGTAPQIDIAAELDDAAAPVAKKFWPKHVMSKSLIDWLDTALVAGQVRNGRALISGDLDDWPFTPVAGVPPQGVFDARATLGNMRVKFHDDWPATSDMDAEIAFIGNGFSVGGKAVLAEVGLRAFDAGIADFSQGALAIDAHADADASKLLGLIRQSPLRKDHGDILTTLGASGPAAVDFALDLPLHGGPAQKARIDGSIDLRGVRLSESQWKLAFSGVNGRAKYDQDGFSANGLRAQYDRQEGRLSLRAGPGHVRDKRQGFEAELEASMTTDDLLDRSSDLDWLKPYVRGRSRWTAGIAIPAGGSARPVPKSAKAPVAAQVTRLQLRSDLVGTAFDLPAPMDKSAGAVLPTTIDLQLPLGKGEVAIAFGQRFALRAKETQGQLGIRAAFGTDRVAEAPPASGLVVSGRAATLDAIGWIALTRGDGGNRLVLRRVDASAERLLLLGANFPDTRLQIAPASGGLAVQLDGPALAGALLVPDAAGGTVAGRLQRLHWRSAGTPATSPTSNGVAANGAGNTGAEINPANIPAMNLRVDDLRIVDAALGDTQFRSRATATGMEILQLQTRASKRRIDLTGDWSGRGAATRTRLSATLASDDFGALLTDLGVGGRIEGGKGEARFDAGWTGSPMAFQMATLDGTLKLDVKGGRLVEVEPGGTGRVLGLLSIAQLPRRLTLDFRDFFSKGFAFNKLAGTVHFGGGSARSDDLAIDGPSARINIRGAANLRAQTFDQTIEVLPKAGNLLTAVGAIAGGPVGAAVGAVANAVLQKPLGQATAKNYRVTGPWKDPKVEVIERPNVSARGAPASVGGRP